MAFLAAIPALFASAGGAAAAGTAAATAGTAAATAGTLGTLGSWLSIGSSVLGGIMSIAQGVQQKNAMEAEASSAQAAAREEANRIRRINDAKLAEGRAIAGTQGTTMEGSPLVVQMENAKQLELEAQTAKFQGRLTGFSKKLQGREALYSGFGNALGSFAQAGYGVGKSLLTA